MLLSSKSCWLCRFRAIRAFSPTWRIWPGGTRSVSTLSAPLASVFNTRPLPKVSFSFSSEDVGLFGKKELRDPTGFYLLKERAIAEADALVDEACSRDRKRKMVEIFDELSDCLCRVADLAEFIRIAHPKSRFRLAAEDACLSIGALVEKLNTNLALYQSLRSSLETNREKNEFSCDEVDIRVAELFKFDFEQCGIHLPEAKRNRVAELNEEILYLGQKFSSGAMAPREVSAKNIPAAFASRFRKASDGTVLISGLMADSSSESVRELAYKLYLSRDSSQERLLERLLAARHEMAAECGFPTYAHRMLRYSLGGNPDFVAEFLRCLKEELAPLAEDDFWTMGNMKKRSQQDAGPVAPWDPPYFTSMAKQRDFGVSSASVAPYFSLGACMQGLDDLLRSLYGVHLELCEIAPGELWSSDVHKLAVVHENDGLLGYVYCDFFDRPNKPHADCHFTIQGGRQLPDGSYQVPIVVLLLSFPPGSLMGSSKVGGLIPGRSPPCLTPNMVDNLFHEFGHALHSVMGRTRYQHVTGTRCPTDFAEVPSTLMEFFAGDPRVIASFATHYKTGEKMPEELIYRLCGSRHVFAAAELQLQLFYSALDQRYHGKHPLGKPVTEILAEVQNEYYGLNHVPDTAWQLRFSHLVGYGAKYYSYLMSRAVSAWIWGKYFKNDPFNRPAGEVIRYGLLAHGGAIDPRELVQGTVGKQVTPEALSSCLVQELKSKRSELLHLSG